MSDADRIELRFANVAKSKTFKNIITPYKLGEKAVLDIGCSYGEHLVHFGKGSVGLTITEPEIEFGKEKGIDIRYGNIESSDFKLDKKFDAIFANNIFEHLFSSHYFLYRIKKFLKQDGLLILGVPCIPQMAFLLRLNKFRGSLSLPHINFFTRGTLIKIVERGGWNIIETRSFHFRSRFVDSLFNPVYPHFYVAARPIMDFQYPEKRMGELINSMDLIFRK